MLSARAFGPATGPRMRAGTSCMYAAAPVRSVVIGARPRVHQAPRSVSFEGAIPEGVKVEVKPAEEGENVDWNPDTKTLRLPINVVEASGDRRTKLVIFTCNKCGGRTARNVNPVAWENGLVLGQCATCGAWHVLSAKNKNIYEEIRYNEDPLLATAAVLAGSGSDSEASTQSRAAISSQDSEDSSSAGSVKG